MTPIILGEDAKVAEKFYTELYSDQGDQKDGVEESASPHLENFNVTVDEGKKQWKQ